MMTDTLFIRPAEGRKVRDPITAEPLPDEGDHKPADSYWLRRLADGDVLLAAEKKSGAKKS